MSEITHAQSAGPDRVRARETAPGRRPTSHGLVRSTKRLDGDGVFETELRTRDEQPTTVSEEAITALGGRVAR
jgi:hypothetical protein